MVYAQPNLAQNARPCVYQKKKKNVNLENSELCRYGRPLGKIEIKRKEG